MRTILIGAGGTGSILARPLQHYLLARFGFDNELIIVDGDQVEEKNLARQLYKSADIGQGKATQLAATLIGHPTVASVFIDEENVQTLFQSSDRVIMAVDNYYARKLIDARSQELDAFTIISPGNEAWSATCQLHIRRGGTNITPRITFQHEEILDSEPPVDLGPNCAVRAEELGEEQTIVANMIAASLALNALVAADEYDIKGTALLFHETHFDLTLGKAGGPDLRKAPERLWA